MAKAEETTERTRAEALALLQREFAADEIELLPRYIGPRDANKRPTNPKQHCGICGGYHPEPSIHLSYVGHAGITMRLNEADPEWQWEPMGTNPDGTPAFSKDGLWIWLTVLGKRLPAFGDADGKTGGNAVKEAIGDAIRNGAMRFGVGTYLWGKSEKAKAQLARGLQGTDEPPPSETAPTASDATLALLRDLREKLKVDDDKYAEQLARCGVDRDTALAQADAETLVSAYTNRLAERKASKGGEAS